MTHDVNKLSFREPEYLHIVIGSESDNSDPPTTEDEINILQTIFLEQMTESLFVEAKNQEREQNEYNEQMESSSSEEELSDQAKILK